MSDRSIGWIGLGRMGLEMCRRLVAAGHDVSIYNRTKEKAAPLVENGATLVDSPSDLAGHDVVFSMVADSAAFRGVMTGSDGLLTGDRGPAIIVDSSTVGADDSAEIRAAAADLGSDVLAAPVSGNPRVVASGGMMFVVSGPSTAFESTRPLLEDIAAGVVYVGDGELARLVKIAHNLYLGVVTQCLAEVTILAQKAGVSRADFLSFINQSPMGSVFSGYKAPAFVNLDFHPTFTGHLLRKDLELGLAASRELDAPIPTVASVHQQLMGLIGRGMGDQDFAALILQQAESAGLELSSEGREVDDGLG